MSREEIMKDKKYKEACSKYGINWENCEVYGEVIALNTPKVGLYILMDKNYNTFYIGKLNSNFESLENFIEEKYEIYCNFTDILPYGENFGYPFENFTLKNIINLSNRVEVIESDLEQPLVTKVNGHLYKRYVDESKANEDYFKLLSYIKFIGENVKKFFLSSYRMQILGFDENDIYLYVRQLICKINEWLDNCLKHYRMPRPIDILIFIGQNYPKAYDNLDIDVILYDIIGLLMVNKGYEIVSKNPDKIKKITYKEKTDLSKLATDLLRILDITDEELKKKTENDRIALVKKQISNFKPWIEEDIEE